MSIDFSRNLIKGRIAEVIFEQMVREENRYAVIPFGYEYTIPTLAQYQNLVEIKRVMENISDAPDFVLISDDKSQVYLVEVKYQNHLNIEVIKEYANKLLNRWNPSWLFILTPDGFFCSPCSSIVKESNIYKLSENWVNMERQNEYLLLVKDFFK